MRTTLLKILSTTVLWGIVIMIKGLGEFSLFGMRMNVTVGIIASVLSILVPSIFDVGVSNWDGASVIDKVSPIILIVIYIIGLKCIGQSLVTVLLSSAFLGFVFTYLGKIIDSELK